MPYYYLINRAFYAVKAVRTEANKRTRPNLLIKLHKTKCDILKYYGNIFAKN